MIRHPRTQQTLSRPVSVSGFGYWTGRDAQVEFRPAPPDSGINFRRSDLPGSAPIPALVQRRIETPRRTTLAVGNVRVEMVEHVLAALAGLQIDNCEVWVNSSELPGCDGSSLPFVEALASAGVVSQGAIRKRLVVGATLRGGDESSWAEARPLAAENGLRIKYRLDYGAESPIGRQTIELDINPKSFTEELAPARTFLLQEEAAWLQQQGLGTRVGPQDVLVFGPEGPIENTLRFEDECVRHKALDLVGDLALCGCDLIGSVVACRSGHRLNAELAKVLLNECSQEKSSLRSA